MAASLSSESSTDSKSKGFRRWVKTHLAPSAAPDSPFHSRPAGHASVAMQWQQKGYLLYSKEGRRQQFAHEDPLVNAGLLPAQGDSAAEYESRNNGAPSQKPAPPPVPPISAFPLPPYMPSNAILVHHHESNIPCHGSSHSWYVPAWGEGSAATLTGNPAQPSLSPVPVTGAPIIGPFQTQAPSKINHGAPLPSQGEFLHAAESHHRNHSSPSTAPMAAFKPTAAPPRPTELPSQNLYDPSGSEAIRQPVDMTNGASHQNLLLPVADRALYE